MKFALTPVATPHAKPLHGLYPRENCRVVVATGPRDREWKQSRRAARTFDEGPLFRACTRENLINVTRARVLVRAAYPSTRLRKVPPFRGRPFRL